MTEQVHPYKRFEGSDLWRILSTAIDELAANDDLREQTRREYVIGYIIQKLVGTGAVREDASIAIATENGE